MQITWIRFVARMAMAVLLLGVGIRSGVPISTVHATTCPTGDTSTFDFVAPNGGQQTFNVPSNVTCVVISAVGAPGGNFAPGGVIQGHGGNGGTVSNAVVTVASSSTLYVEVGGAGTNGNCAFSSGAPGGFNGGGTNNGPDTNGACGGSTGGGASDVRTLPNTVVGTIGSRLVVAGGGGGAGAPAGGGAGGSGLGTPTGANGGDGSNETAFGGTATGGGGGTQTGGGSAGAAPVTSPPNQEGSDGNPGTDILGGAGVGAAGAGGAGYYGGGSGGDIDPGAGFQAGAGGGAGSSFAPDTTGVTFGTDSSGTPSVTIQYANPTAAPYSRFHLRASGGWTTMQWVTTSHVLGFNVYDGQVKLNHRLITSRTRIYGFRFRGSVTRPRLEARPVT